MPKPDDSELDCSDLTDVSEQGLVNWMDKHNIFAPADAAPLNQDELHDPCEGYQPPPVQQKMVLPSVLDDVRQLTVAERCDAAMSGNREPDPDRQRRPGGAPEDYDI